MGKSLKLFFSILSKTKHNQDINFKKKTDEKI